MRPQISSELLGHLFQPGKFLDEQCLLILQDNKITVPEFKLTQPELVAESPNPSFLAVDPAQRFLFAANEIGDYQRAKSGAVSSFTIDRHTGKLGALNMVASRGADPCHLTVDKNSRHVLVANYSGGSVAVLPVKDDGILEPASDFVQHLGLGRQDQRHVDRR